MRAVRPIRKESEVFYFCLILINVKDDYKYFLTFNYNWCSLNKKIRLHFNIMSESTRKNRVKKFREGIPLSMAELARRAGLAPQTVAKMEKGLPTRKNSELKVAKALMKQYEESLLE